MDNNKKAMVVLDDFFGDDKLTHDMSAREAWDCIKRLLKEQKTVNWIKCTDKLPNVDGCYLVVKSIMGRYSKIDVCEFTLNLHDTDEFDFPDEKRPGWYECDPETGYFEWTGITHWATLPRLPEGINEGR